MSTSQLRFSLVIILIYPLLLLFCAYIVRENSMHEILKVILYVSLLFAYVVFSWSFYQRVTNDNDKLNQKQKEVDDLESFASHMMRRSDLSDFVREVVDIHLKNKRSIKSYQEFFFRLVCNDGKVYTLFIHEIKRSISEQKEILERSEKSNSDINHYALALSSLNELLQAFVETRESGAPKLGRLCYGEVESRKNEPTFGCGVGVSN